MKHLKYKLTKILALFVFMSALALIFSTMWLETSSAQSSQAEPSTQAQGLITIWGKVYRSDGFMVGQEYDGAYAAVIIEHNGVKTTHVDDEGGLQNGYYKCTIQEGYWSPNDKYSIMIDGSGWGDLPKYNADGIRITPDQKVVSSGLDHWRLSGPGQVNRDVITLAEKPSTPTNFEPLIGIVCAIMIGFIGILFLVIFDKQKVNILILDKSDYRIRGIHGIKKWEGLLAYTCGYGEPRKPKKIGEIFGTAINVKVESIQQVSVNKIIRTKDGKYIWYKPKLISDRKPAKTPGRVDRIEDLDALWFAGGGLELESGESLPHAVRIYRIRRFVLLVLPFVMIELLMAVSSWYDLFMATSWDSPVIMGNFLILAIGIVAAFWAYRRTAMVKRPEAHLEEELPEVKPDSVRPSVSRYSPKPLEQAARAAGPTGAGAYAGAGAGADVIKVEEDLPITRQRYLPPINQKKPVQVAVATPKAVMQEREQEQPLNIIPIAQTVNRPELSDAKSDINPDGNDGTKQIEIDVPLKVNRYSNTGG